MSYPAMLTDAGGNIIPQYWDGAAWQPYEGNPNPRLSGSTGTISGTNSNTSLTISLGNIGSIDAKVAYVTISNDGTSQTITGATLQFSETVGSESPTITYQSKSSFSLVSTSGSNTATILIPIDKGILSTASLVVTFGTAPVAGSVSCTIQLSDKSNFVIGPTLIDTIPAASFTASNTLYKSYTNVLHRSASERTIFVVGFPQSNLNSIQAMIEDSAVDVRSQSITGTVNLNTTNYNSTSSSAQFAQLAAQGDSLALAYACGGTTPSSGNNLYVYVTEVFQ